jgi:hypothetical protein
LEFTLEKYRRTINAAVIEDSKYSYFVFFLQLNDKTKVSKKKSTEEEENFEI